VGTASTGRKKTVGSPGIGWPFQRHSPQRTTILKPKTSRNGLADEVIAEVKQSRRRGQQAVRWAVGSRTENIDLADFIEKHYLPRYYRPRRSTIARAPTLLKGQVLKRDLGDLVSSS